MLQETFERIMTEYPTARNEPFSDHPLIESITYEIPSYLTATLDAPNIVWKASAGKGKWSDAPWIAALSLLVTDTPQRGYYPVYIFSRSMDAVYLFLNQGMTELKNEFGVKTAREIMVQRAKILRARNPEFGDTFSEDSISLQATSPASRLAMYQAGHVFGKQYRRHHIPHTAHLLDDLRQMLDVYAKAVFRGGFDDLGTEEVLEGEEFAVRDGVKQKLEEIKRYRYHRTIERNGALADQAKQVHGYRCQVCGFDFYEAYGEIGKHYVEAHHRTPLSALAENETVFLSPEADFAVLCSNCHRMIHRKGAPATFEEFKQHYSYLRTTSS